MCEKEAISTEISDLNMSSNVVDLVYSYQIDKAVGVIWEQIRECDTLINQREVWKLTGDEKKTVLTDLVMRIKQIGADLQPFMPKTAEKILNQYNNGSVTKGDPLFLRLQTEA